DGPGQGIARLEWHTNARPYPGQAEAPWRTHRRGTHRWRPAAISRIWCSGHRGSISWSWNARRDSHSTRSGAERLGVDPGMRHAADQRRTHTRDVEAATG